MRIKKLLSLSILLIGSVMLIGCGKEADVTVNESVAESVEVSSQSNANQSDKNELVNTHKVTGKQIFMDVPNYRVKEYGYVDAFVVTGAYHFGVVHDEETVSDLKQAYELNSKKMIKSSKVEPFNSFNIEEEAYVKINGFDMYKFKGKANIGSIALSDIYMYGYTFIIDGCPVSVIGFVDADEQEQKYIDEITRVVDLVINTVRDHDKGGVLYV